MDVAAEVRTVVVALPTGCVATYGEIGRALGIGPRQADDRVDLATIHAVGTDGH